jgi:mannose-1-phosphate guanylyltransferase
MDFDNSGTFLANTAHDAKGSASEETSQPASAASITIVPVILSGGGGSRLWPFSTEEKPKQFLPLAEERSLFQEALARVSDREQFASPVVVGSIRHAELCAQELAQEGAEARLILEPCARNTAPAIVMAAAAIRELHGPEALLLVMPSDHVIEDVAAFHEAIMKAVPAANAGQLVTFGVRPTGADTGYGYLEMGAEIASGVMQVARFVEKPDLKTAERMVAGGQHLWNAGIFLFQAEALIDEAARVAPDIARCAQDAVRDAERDGIRITPSLEAFAGCPSESIDYAVMEHAANVAVVPMSPGWSDLGSWDALASLIGGTVSQGPVTVLDCNDCYIRSDGLEVAALGLRDLIVVASGQRLLVLPRGRSQEVKRLLAAMDSQGAQS